MQIINNSHTIQIQFIYLYIFFEKIRNNSNSYFHFDQKNQHSKWCHKFLCKNNSFNFS